jgi:hypothetical protein
LIVLHRIADRKIAREGVSGDIHIAIGIDRHPIGPVAKVFLYFAVERAAASEIG